MDSVHHARYASYAGCMDKGYLEVLRQVVGAQHEGNASKIAQLDGKLSEIRAQLASDPDPINLRWFECQVVERALQSSRM
jgi:hypothetical protein